MLHAPSLNPSPAYTAVYTLRGSVCSCRRTCQQPGPQQLLGGTRLAWPSLPALVPIATSVSARSLRHCMGTAAGCHNQVCVCHQLWPSPLPTLTELEVLFSSHYGTPLPHAVLTKEHSFLYCGVQWPELKRHHVSPDWALQHTPTLRTLDQVTQRHNMIQYASPVGKRLPSLNSVHEVWKKRMLLQIC